MPCVWIATGIWATGCAMELIEAVQSALVSAFQIPRGDRDIVLDLYAENRRIVSAGQSERYTRVAADWINWVITVDDPKTWTQPWSFMIRLKRSDDQVYEYACHEGNHSMIGILAGARKEDAKEEAAANAKKTGQQP